MNDIQPLKSIHLLLSKSEELVLMKALHLLALARDQQPDSLEKRLEASTNISLLIKLQEQLYERREE